MGLWHTADGGHQRCALKWANATKDHRWHRRPEQHTRRGLQPRGRPYARIPPPPHGPLTGGGGGAERKVWHLKWETCGGEGLCLRAPAVSSSQGGIGTLREGPRGECHGPSLGGRKGEASHGGKGTGLRACGGGGGGGRPQEGAHRCAAADQGNGPLTALPRGSGRVPRVEALGTLCGVGGPPPGLGEGGGGGAVVFIRRRGGAWDGTPAWVRAHLP